MSDTEQPIVIPTQHAIDRVRQRAPGVVRIKAFLDYLWSTGSELSPDELAWRRERDGQNHDYRITTWRGATYLVVQIDTGADVFYKTLVRKDRAK